MITYLLYLGKNFRMTKWIVKISTISLDFSDIESIHLFEKKPFNSRLIESYLKIESKTRADNRSIFSRYIINFLISKYEYKNYLQRQPKKIGTKR